MVMLGTWQLGLHWSVACEERHIPSVSAHGWKPSGSFGGFSFDR